MIELASYRQTKKKALWKIESCACSGRLETRATMETSVVYDMCTHSHERRSGTITATYWQRCNWNEHLKVSVDIYPYIFFFVIQLIGEGQCFYEYIPYSLQLFPIRWICTFICWTASELRYVCMFLLLIFNLQQDLKKGNAISVRSLITQQLLVTPCATYIRNRRSSLVIFHKSAILKNTPKERKI